MMKSKYYIANALTGAVFGYLGYLVFIFSEHRAYNFAWATITSFVGFIIGATGIAFLKKKGPDVYNSPYLTVRSTLSINLYLYFGIFLGLGAGMSASYILFIIFSAIFGHPESDAWRGGLWYVFIFIAIVINVFSLFSFTRSTFMYGIKHIEMKNNT